MASQKEILEALKEKEDAKKKYCEASKRFRAIKESCNHTHSDGKTAIVEGYFGKHCDICGWDDHGS